MKRVIYYVLFLLFLYPGALHAEDYDMNTVVTQVDSYYTTFVNYVGKKTKFIRFDKIRTRLEDRLWSSLLNGVQNKLSLLDGEQKIIFQSLRSKIAQRKSGIQFSTSDIVLQRKLISELNNLRKDLGLGTLSYNALLSQAAYNHANDMYLHFPYDTNGDGVKELIAHVGTDGTRVQDRVQAVGYIPYFVGENIAYNQTSVNEVITDRKNSPTHYANLITDKAIEVGVAKLGSYRVLVVGKSRENR